MTDATSSPQGPFAGVRVLELTTGTAGRTAGMLLADFGAEVARIVPSDEPKRPWGPGQLCWDRGKLLATLDRSVSDGATELRRLVEAADVVLTDARPGELERQGLDAATVLDRDPAVVHAWLPPYAARGRWSQLPDDPLLLAAAGGFAAHHPAVEDRPVAPVVSTISALHGALGATAVAAALVGRATSGRGRAVTVSGLHAVAAAQSSMMVAGLDVAEIFSPGKSQRGAPNFRMYRAGDGRWLYLAALTPDFFFRALDALDRVDVMVRSDVGGEFSNLLVPEVGAAVGADLEASFTHRTCDEWLTILRDAGVPAAPVSTRDEWMASEVVSANHARLDIEHSELGSVTVPGIPITLSETPGAVRHLPGDEHVVPARTLWRESSGHSAPTSRAATSATDSPQDLPLAGLRVLDLSTFLAAPFASAVLADYGADVVKIEAPTGDPYRVFSASYTAVNQRKSAAALDLREPDGHAALLELVRHSDVLVDNLRPASLDRLGLGADVLAAANPRLIRCSVSAYGHPGSWADVPGFDPVIQALSGLASAQGGGDEPVATTAPMHDVGAGTLTALGALAALFARGHTSRGQRVTTSLAAVSTFLQSAEMTGFAGSPAPAEGGTDYPGPTATHRYYRAADGWLAVAARTRFQIHCLLEAAGHPEWDTLDEATLAERLGGALASRPVIEWVDELAAREVPACSVLDRNGELDAPFLVENEFSHVVSDPELGRLRVVRTYSDWHGAAPRRAASGAGVGQHTGAVLREAGISPELARPSMEGGSS